MRNARFLKDERAQMMAIFAVAFTMLLLFTGMAIDAGILYLTKSKLAAAVDGACLAGMKNLQQGHTTATSIATNIFNANYGSNAPVPAITFPVDASGNQQVQVTATASVHTLFMQLIPRYAYVPVSDTAVSTRGKLIMTLALDRSGSMGPDGGLAGLQAVVPTFIANFDQTPNTGDEVGMASFSSNATIGYAINYSFITPIDNAVSSMSPAGGTFGTGAGTGSLLSTTIGPPLSLAGAQNDGVTINAGQNVVKVIVYLTDGLMNAVQDNFHCGGKNNSTLTLLNYGGYDVASGSTQYALMIDPTSATNDFGNATSSGFYYDSKNDYCLDASGNKVTKFPSQQPGQGAGLSFLQTNVTGEAQYRAKQTAIALESEASHPNFVYTIGLGSGVSTSTQMLLKEIANDPTADTYSTSRTTGAFYYIKDCPSTPSTTCDNEVRQVFQTIAAKVLLRLTQ